MSRGWGLTERRFPAPLIPLSWAGYKYQVARDAGRVYDESNPVRVSERVTSE